ncbi:MAG: aldehyde dehydrogenase family protein, partial [Pirellulales bacterium]
MKTQNVLIAGAWRAAKTDGTFQAENPDTGETLQQVYPISSWHDCDEALTAAAQAAGQLRQAPADSLAAFLERYAERIEARAAELVATAHTETGYPVSPRLADVELPRTTGQLRQAADAAREGWGG